MIDVSPDLWNNGVGAPGRADQRCGDRHPAPAVRGGRRRLGDGARRHAKPYVGPLFQGHGVGGRLGAGQVQHLEGEGRPDLEAPAVGLRHVFQLAEIVDGDQLTRGGRDAVKPQHSLPPVIAISVDDRQRDDLHLAELVSLVRIAEAKVALAEGQLTVPVDSLGEARRGGSGVGQRRHRLGGWRPRLPIHIDGHEPDGVGGAGSQAGQRDGSPGIDGCKPKDIWFGILRVAQQVALDRRGAGGIGGSYGHQHRGGPDLREGEGHRWRLPFVHIGHLDVDGYGYVDGGVGASLEVATVAHVYLHLVGVLGRLVIEIGPGSYGNLAAPGVDGEGGGVGPAQAVGQGVVRVRVGGRHRGPNRGPTGGVLRHLPAQRAGIREIGGEIGGDDKGEGVGIRGYPTRLVDDLELRGARLAEVVIRNEDQIAQVTGRDELIRVDDRAQGAVRLLQLEDAAIHWKHSDDSQAHRHWMLAGELDVGQGFFGLFGGELKVVLAKGGVLTLLEVLGEIGGRRPVVRGGGGEGRRGALPLGVAGREGQLIAGPGLQGTDADGVGRAVRSLLGCRGAIGGLGLELEFGDGRAPAVDRGFPRDGETGVGNVCDLRVHRSKRRLVHVRHVDGEVDRGGRSVDRPVHLAGVGGLGLVVQRGAFRHADLAGGGVDLERARGRRLAGQGVGQRLRAVGSSRHGVAHVRVGGGVLGDAPRYVRKATNRDDLEDVSAVPVMCAVGDIGSACNWVEEMDPQILDWISVFFAIFYGGGDDAGRRGRRLIRQRVAVGIGELVVDSLNGVAAAQLQDIGGIEAARR